MVDWSATIKTASMADKSLSGKVALITGGAHRIGASIAHQLHDEGMNLVIHYRNSKKSAHALQETLHARRSDSVVLVNGDLLKNGVLSNLVYETIEAFGRRFQGHGLSVFR
jgi:pteridine reductase